MIDGSSSALRLYRVYHLTQAGHIQRAEILEARDDTDALVKLKEKSDDHDVELWDRSRFIGKIEAVVAKVTAPSTAPALDPLPYAASNNGDSNASRMATKLFKPLFAILPENDDTAHA